MCDGADEHLFHFAQAAANVVLAACSCSTRAGSVARSRCQLLWARGRAVCSLCTVCEQRSKGARCASWRLAAEDGDCGLRCCSVG